MKFYDYLIPGLTLAAFALASPARAQTLGTSRGFNGQTVTGSSAGRTRAFSSGTSGASGGSAGGGGVGAAPTEVNFGDFGSATGINRQQGGIVGAGAGSFGGAAQQGNTGGQGNRSGGGQFNNRFQNQNRGGQQGRNNRNNRQGTGASQQIYYPPVLRLGFTMPAQDSLALSERLVGRLESLRQRSVGIGLGAGSQLKVNVANRTAILRGKVATEHDRALAAQILMLEPGVSHVQNELTLAR